MGSAILLGNRKERIPVAYRQRTAYLWISWFFLRRRWEPNEVATPPVWDRLPMHPRFAPFLFGLLLSGLMSFFVSGIATFERRASSMASSGFWMSAWLPSWAVAFPTVLIAAPIVRRIVARVTRVV